MQLMSDNYNVNTYSNCFQDLCEPSITTTEEVQTTLSTF